MDPSVKTQSPGAREQIRFALLANQDGILTKTSQRLARIAHARGMEPATIDDIIQETLLEAWSHLERLQSPAGFFPWIDEICRNVCRRFAHRRVRDLRRHIPLPRLCAAAEETDEHERERALTALTAASTDPLDELDRRDLTAVLDLALGVLPETTRRLIEMCYLLELPRAEVAARLGIKGGTLETRLHRARRQLRRILHGPLRPEAEAAELLAPARQNENWQTTRMWCPQCGTHRLQGCFPDPGCDDVGPNLHIRCPECSRRYNQDIVHSMGLVPLTGLRTFQPAWKRTMRGLSERITRALSQKQPACLYCGKPALIQVQRRESEFPGPAGPSLFWVRLHCTFCGREINTSGNIPSVDQLVYWSHPLTRQFLQEHPRWQSSPGSLGTYEGQSALRFELADREGGSQLTVFVHQETLRVLALFPQRPASLTVDIR